MMSMKVDDLLVHTPCQLISCQAESNADGKPLVCIILPLKWKTYIYIYLQELVHRIADRLALDIGNCVIVIDDIIRDKVIKF